jgi:hypothetical protein
MPFCVINKFSSEARCLGSVGIAAVCFNLVFVSELCGPLLHWWCLNLAFALKPQLRVYSSLLSVYHLYEGFQVTQYFTVLWPTKGVDAVRKQESFIFICNAISRTIHSCVTTAMVMDRCWFSKRILVTLTKSKKQAKQSRYTPCRRLGGEVLIHDLGTKSRWVVSVTPRPRFTSGETTLGTHWTGGWVDPRAGMNTADRGKILCPCRESNPDRPVVQSAVRHYTDWANPAPSYPYYSPETCYFM